MFAITERAYLGVASPFTRVVSDPLFGPSATPGLRGDRPSRYGAVRTEPGR